MAAQPHQPRVIAASRDTERLAHQVLARWQRAARSALAMTLVKTTLQSMGIEPVGDSPGELRATIERESRKSASPIQ